MVASYTEELVYTESEDGLLLEGAVIRPAGGSTKSVPVVWIHGLTGKFYSRSTVRIGRELASRGYTFVVGNNRGHDFGTIYRNKANEPLILGGGWENFDESPRDVAGWLNFTEGLGFRQVALLGHSLGSLKVAYYQGMRQDPRVLGLVGASPPARAGNVEPELLAQAERMVAEGRGQDLLPWGISQAGAGTTSAQTYLNRARTNVDVYGFFTPDPVIAKVRCPLLACYGTDEAWVGGANELELIRKNARAAARVDTRLFADADHNYNGQHVQVATALAEWVDTLT